MEPLFINKTKYSKQVYKKFIEFHQNKYGRQYSLYTIVVVLLFIFCLAMQIRYDNFQLASIFILAIILFLLWRFFHPIKELKDELKSDKLQEEQTFTFSFYPNFFIISNGSEKNKCYYWKLYKVFETSDFIYLYINKKYAYLLSKKCFCSGNYNDFNSFIRKKCWLRVHFSL